MRSATGQSEPDVDLTHLEEIEKRFDKFKISVAPDLTIRGSLHQGYALNVPNCEGSSTVIGTGACCLPDGTCEVVTPGQCLLDGGTFIGGPCIPNPCPEPPFDCGSALIFTCVGIMCDTNPGGGSYTSIFNLSPGFLTPAAHLSGTVGPSDFASLAWTIDITLDGMGGYSVTYGGTVTGRYGDTQSFTYSFSGTCGVLHSDLHTDRFICPGAGECSGTELCFLAFDSGLGFEVRLQFS